VCCCATQLSIVSVARTSTCIYLEFDSSLVVGKVDCCNAFNAIHKHPILQVIADEAHALLPFANCLLNNAPAETIHHNPREQVTVFPRVVP
jgi:hypothetical protein